MPRQWEAAVAVAAAAAAAAKAEAVGEWGDSRVHSNTIPTVPDAEDMDFFWSNERSIHPFIHLSTYCWLVGWLLLG